MSEENPITPEEQTEVTDPQAKKDPPIQTIRDKAVVAKLWREEAQDGRAFVSVSIGRTYKNEKTGEYGEARNFSGTNILQAQALLGEAYQEARNWERHFREIEREQGALQPEQSEALAERDEGLAQQRDQAMANAAAPARKQGRERSPER